MIATASGRNLEFVRSLKANQVVNYEATAFEDVVSSVDIVFDAVGVDSLDRSWSLLRAGGRTVTVAADSESSTDARVKGAFFIVKPNYQPLTDLSPLLEAGFLRPFVSLRSPLSEAPEIFSG